MTDNKNTRDEQPDTATPKDKPASTVQTAKAQVKKYEIERTLLSGYDGDRW